MDKKDNDLLVSPPLQVGDYIKLSDHSGLLVHEGLLAAAPGSNKPFRDDGWGLWTYFFQNFPKGVSICTPHQVDLADGTGYRMRANPFLVLRTKEK